MSNLTIQQKLRAMGGYFDNATETQISCKYVADYIDALQSELDALRQQLASSEPVAWYVYVEEKDNAYYVDSLDDDECVDDCTNHNATVTPLYENPQSASVDVLVSALEQLLSACIDSNDHGYGTISSTYIEKVCNKALAKYKKGEKKWYTKLNQQQSANVI